MVTLSYYTNGFFLDFPGLYILLEGFLILFGLVFLSVLGYYIFAFSMMDDHDEKKDGALLQSLGKCLRANGVSNRENRRPSDAEDRFARGDGGACRFDRFPSDSFIWSIINESI